MLPSLSDVRVALRTLRRAPLVSVAAVLTLAVGIGPTVAMATLVYSALVRPLPYPESERLVTTAVEDLTSGELMPPPAGAVADGVAAMTSFESSACRSRAVCSWVVRNRRLSSAPE